jgi:predicted CoA-binding protein
MQTFEGDRRYPNVDSIPGGVEGVVIVTRPEATERIVRECADAGVRRVWMHQSMGKGTSVSSEAVEYCRQHDISDRRCLPDDVRPWRPLRTRACGGSSKRRGDGARRSHHHANLC